MRSKKHDLKINKFRTLNVKSNVKSKDYKIRRKHRFVT